MKWDKEANNALRKAIVDCAPLFERHHQKPKVFKKTSIWDAVAGRMLPDYTVSGEACRKQHERMKKEAHEKSVEKADDATIETMIARLDTLYDIMDTIYCELLGCHYND